MAWRYITYAERDGWIRLFPVGEWEHPSFGKESFSKQRLQRFVENFERGIPQKRIPIMVDHGRTGTEAVGWIDSMEVRDDGLWAKPAWNDLGKQLIAEKRFLFYSPSRVDEWTHPETKQKFKDVLVEVSLTNRPFFGWLQQPLSLSRPLECSVFSYDDGMMVGYQQHQWRANRPPASFRGHPERGRAWDADAAEARWRAFNTDGELDWTGYRRGFLAWDAANPEEFQSYKLLVVDVINGQPRIIWRALNAVNVVLGGGRGGVDLPEDVKSQVADIVESLRERFPEETEGGAEMSQTQTQDEARYIALLEQERKKREELERRYAELEFERRKRTYQDQLSELVYDDGGVKKSLPKPHQQKWAEFLCKLTPELAQECYELLKSFALVEFGRRTTDMELPPDDGAHAFTQLVMAKVKEGLSYSDAFAAVASERPDLYEQYRKSYAARW